MNIAFNIKIKLINKLFSTRWWRYWLSWYDLWAIIDVLRQQDELERLVLWAKRKRLSRMREYYRSLLLNREAQLSAKQMRFSTLFACAEWVYSFQSALCPSTRYTAGSAAKYRFRNYQCN
jgi:hypothetical protein